MKIKKTKKIFWDNNSQARNIKTSMSVDITVGKKKKNKTKPKQTKKTHKTVTIPVWQTNSQDLSVIASKIQNQTCVLFLTAPAVT